jgi:hypothetical protein
MEIFHIVLSKKMNLTRARESPFVRCTVPDFCFRKKGLSGEENMVLGHIQAAANQGDY